MNRSKLINIVESTLEMYLVGSICSFTIPKSYANTTSLKTVEIATNTDVNKYLFRWNKDRRSLVNWPWNLYSFFLKQEEEEVLRQQPFSLMDTML